MSRCSLWKGLLKAVRAVFGFGIRPVVSIKPGTGLQNNAVLPVWLFWIVRWDSADHPTKNRNFGAVLPAVAVTEAEKSWAQQSPYMILLLGSVLRSDRLEGGVQTFVEVRTIPVLLRDLHLAFTNLLRTLKECSRQQCQIREEAWWKAPKLNRYSTSMN